MERAEAYRQLKTLEGEDLFSLAEEYGVTVWNQHTGKQNKGWFGHVIEHYLGLPRNSAQSPNFGSWELKTTSLKILRSGKLVPKETVAITMIDPYEVALKPFEDSHLLAKLRKMILVSRIVEGSFQDKGLVHTVSKFDLVEDKVLSQIREDYELVRNRIKEKGFDSLTGRMGIFVQPRTKGPGHGSTSRAFYARKNLVKLILGLE